MLFIFRNAYPRIEECIKQCKLTVATASNVHNYKRNKKNNCMILQLESTWWFYVFYFYSFICQDILHYRGLHVVPIVLGDFSNNIILDINGNCRSIRKLIQSESCPTSCGRSRNMSSIKLQSVSFQWNFIRKVFQLFFDKEYNSKATKLKFVIPKRTNKRTENDTMARC